KVAERPDATRNARASTKYVERRGRRPPRSASTTTAPMAIHPKTQATKNFATSNGFWAPRSNTTTVPKMAAISDQRRATCGARDRRLGRNAYYALFRENDAMNRR